MVRYLLIIVGAVLAIVGIFALRRKRVYPSAESLLQDPNVDAVVTHTPDDAWHIHWSIDAKSASIYTGQSPDGIDMSVSVATVTNAQEVKISNIPTEQPRYFRLAFSGGKTIIAAEREIRLEGAVNFRDVGGYRTREGRAVKWGKLFRAGQLAELTETDLITLRRLGVSLSCDLRLPEEIEEAPDRLPEGTRYEQISVQSSESRRKQIRRLMLARGQIDDFMTSAYIRVIVDSNPHVYARVFELLADENNLPMVVHCTAGKDRTGVAIALLFDLLGVPDDVIAADYSLSNHYFDNYVAIGEKAIRSIGRLGLTTEAILPLFTADPQTILATLAHIRVKYGSSEGYLMQAGGLSTETLNQVRKNMLE